MDKRKKVKKSSIKENISSFLITINTQGKNKENIPKLKSAFLQFYDEIENYIIDKVINGNTKIEKIVCQAAIEKGRRTTRYHLHSLIKITHNGKLQLNIDKMRDFFNEKIPLGIDKHLHISVRFVNDPTFKISKYFEKENLEL